MMEWYLSLNIHQKVNVKQLSKIITGLTWEELGMIFDFKERVEIITSKLIMEGYKLN